MNALTFENLTKKFYSIRSFKYIVWLMKEDLDQMRLLLSSQNSIKFQFLVCYCPSWQWPMLNGVTWILNCKQKKIANCNHIYIRCAGNRFHIISENFISVSCWKQCYLVKFFGLFLWWCFDLCYYTNLRLEAESIPVAWGIRDRKQNLVYMLV